MGIFKKNKAVEVVEQPANYNTALDYLIGLSSDDYTKICHVAAIHRQADYEACQVLGVKCEPTTFIKQPVLKSVPLSEHPLHYEQLPKKTKRGKK